MPELFKLVLPSDFKADVGPRSVVARGPDGRMLQAGPIKWRARFPFSIPAAKLAIDIRGPGALAGAFRKPARQIIEQNADPGSVVITAEEESHLGPHPALLLKAHYSKNGEEFQVHGYFSFSGGQPCYVFFIAPAGSGMEWTPAIAQKIELQP